MNLGHHLRVLWNHRALALGGLIVGLALAFLAAFDVPSLERRGAETWSAQSKILVTQAGFPEGRVTLPGTADEESSEATPGGGSQTFADPGRLSSLALLYSVIALSDQVRGQLDERPQLDQIQAVALDPTGHGQNFLPVILLTTQADTAAEAETLNANAYAAFRGVLESQQNANDIPASERIRLTVLERPAEATLVSGYSITPSILAFALCALSAFAAAHILEGLSLRRTLAAAGLENQAFDAAPAGAAPPNPTSMPIQEEGRRAAAAGGPPPERPAPLQRESTPYERREAKAAERRRRRHEAAERRAAIALEHTRSNGHTGSGSTSPQAGPDTSERAGSHASRSSDNGSTRADRPARASNARE